jgi:hypothetical protein
VRSATTIEAAALLLSRSRVQGVRLLSTLALAGWVLLACGVPPVEVGNAPANNDCLREVTLEELPAALRRCDASVQAFPTDPRPLSERSVLHSLGGDRRPPAGTSNRPPNYCGNRATELMTPSWPSTSASGWRAARRRRHCPAPDQGATASPWTHQRSISCLTIAGSAWRRKAV